MGLVISPDYLVELHGGTVEAHSAGEGQGATFMVRLPMRAVADEIHIENKSADVTGGGEAPATVPGPSHVAVGCILRS